ncbi:MAG: hypothetical protein LJE68_15175 [Rhodobacter sp.]|nr:hypothetical protein [Rhodobacter sp.]
MSILLTPIGSGSFFPPPDPGNARPPDSAADTQSIKPVEESGGSSGASGTGSNAGSANRNDASAGNSAPFDASRSKASDGAAALSFVLDQELSVGPPPAFLRSILEAAQSETLFPEGDEPETLAKTTAPEPEQSTGPSQTEPAARDRPAPSAEGLSYDAARGFANPVDPPAVDTRS